MNEKIIEEIQVPYGRKNLRVHIPSTIALDIVQPKDVAAAPDQKAEIEMAIDNPLGGLELDTFHNSRDVVIVVSDKTRPMPHDIILPPILNRLESLGIQDENIIILIATGAHDPMSSDEFKKILPSPIIEKYQIISHDATDDENLLSVGITSRGTPIRINKRYLKSDLRIATGCITPHQFVGFTGGAKSVVIGLGGIDTIRANHSMMNHPDARLGVYEDNPVRNDIDEAGKQIGIDLVLNVVLNSDGKIVRAFAGFADEVQKSGVNLCRTIAQVEIAEKADIIIASPGGYPKDINLYQAQKALAHASQIIKEGGTIIVVAECAEGVGDDRYESWMVNASSLDDITKRFEQEGFNLGSHKAYLWARDLTKTDAHLVSSMDSTLVRKLFLNPATSIDRVLRMAIERHGPNARVAVMPYASATVAKPMD
jgi:nickel-dependent lactate racemase